LDSCWRKVIWQWNDIAT